MSFNAHPTEPSPPRQPSVTKVFENGIELNWLPPMEPNGEVHYVIYYTPEGGIEQLNDTGSNLTHYNLTGLERNRVYTNIAVQAVNSADNGKSVKRAVIAHYNHTPIGECQCISYIRIMLSTMQLNVKYIIIFICKYIENAIWMSS